MSDTIFAEATGGVRAGIAVIRISGPEAVEALRSLTRRDPPPYRMMALRELAVGGEVIDQPLVVCFEAGKSFTGDLVVELHLHGGRAICDKVLELLSEIPGLRLAEPGEFTRRAFLAGRLSSSQVEGLADLIEADTEAQRRMASGFFKGELDAFAARLRERVVEALALLEASMDFADEEDAPTDVSARVVAQIDDARREISEAVAAARFSERLSTGFRVALVGPPNAGKSTLMNRFLGRERAIVSARPGTTRDLLEVQCNLNGLPVTLLDTAGLRSTGDEIEVMGIERALSTAEDADLVLLLIPSGESFSTEWMISGVASAKVLRVSTKCDLGRVDGSLNVSGLTGEGVDSLVTSIHERLSASAPGGVSGLRPRQVANAMRALDLLGRARCAEPELAAVHLRDVVHALSDLTGDVDAEDVLDAVFSRFCMGK